MGELIAIGVLINKNTSEGQGGGAVIGRALNQIITVL